MAKINPLPAVILGATICLLCFSCPGQAHANPGTPLRVDSRCAFIRIEGTARIASASWNVPEPGKTAPPPVIDLVFSFSPADPAQKNSYRFPAMPDENQKIRIYLPQAYLELGRKELVTGSVIRCIRNEITSGACTPVVFIFPDYEMAQQEALP